MYHRGTEIVIKRKEKREREIDRAKVCWCVAFSLISTFFSLESTLFRSFSLLRTLSKVFLLKKLRKPKVSTKTKNELLRPSLLMRWRDGLGRNEVLCLLFRDHARLRQDDRTNDRTLAQFAVTTTRHPDADNGNGKH